MNESEKEVFETMVEQALTSSEHQREALVLNETLEYVEIFDEAHKVFKELLLKMLRDVQAQTEQPAEKSSDEE
jgi:hypothetical protein